MVYRIPYHGILNHLAMVYRTPYPWYIESPTHGISIPYPGILSPLRMVYRTRYTWYFEPSTHGISNPFSHGILTTLHMVYQAPSYGIMNPLNW